MIGSTYIIYAQTFLLLALLLLIYRIIGVFIVQKRLYYVLFGFAALTAATALGLKMVYPGFSQLFYTNPIVMVYDWMRVVSVAGVLCGLALYIRNSKPVINQSPVILSFLPVLLLAIQPLVMETIVLKEMLMQIYMGGSLFVGLLIFGRNDYLNKRFSWLMGGLILLLIAYAGVVTGRAFLNASTLYVLTCLFAGLGTIFISLEFGFIRRSMTNSIN